MPILQMRKRRIRKIKNFPRTRQESDIYKQIIIEHLLWLWRHNGKQNKVSAWIFVKKGIMNQHLRYQSALCHAAYWGQKRLATLKPASLPLNFWPSGMETDPQSLSSRLNKVHWGERALVQTLLILLSSRLTFIKLFHFSVPHFPHL